MFIYMVGQSGKRKSVCEWAHTLSDEDRYRVYAVMSGCIGDCTKKYLPLIMSLDMDLLDSNAVVAVYHLSEKLMAMD